jgi:hypothetical protein
MENKAPDSGQIKLGVKSDEQKNCQKCSNIFKSGEFVSYKDSNGVESVFCIKCEEEIKNELDKKGKEVKLTKPFWFGLGAALAASIGWSIISIATGYDMGYFGLFAAIIICKAILKATNQVRSNKIRVMAVVMTSLAVIISHVTTALYFSMKIDGNESQIFTVLIGLLLLPRLWGPVLWEVALVQGPIGWFIIGLSIYTAYNMTNPKIIVAKTLNKNTPGNSINANSPFKKQLYEALKLGGLILYCAFIMMLIPLIIFLRMMDSYKLFVILIILALYEFASYKLMKKWFFKNQIKTTGK